MNELLVDSGEPMKAFRLPRSLSSSLSSVIVTAAGVRIADSNGLLKNRAASKLVTSLLRETKIFSTTKDNRCSYLVYYGGNEKICKFPFGNIVNLHAWLDNNLLAQVISCIILSSIGIYFCFFCL